MLNILFYKYVEIEDPKKLQEEQIKLCQELNLLGRFLIAQEGINGNLSGSETDCKTYMGELKKNQRFSDIDFKIGKTTKHNFKKLTVKIKKEIVTYRINANLHNKAEYIEPEQLKELLDNDEEVILIDVRNRYENKIGNFKRSVRAEMDVSRELPEAVKKLEHLKDKQIVTYCTGGIRCEKASAYLKEQGFTNVKQLHGGIIKYGEKVGNTHWNGKCFVFDTRGAVDIDPTNQNKPISQCETCYLPEDDYYNCTEYSCDRRFIACTECHERLEGYCSKRCRNTKQIKITSKT